MAETTATAPSSAPTPSSTPAPAATRPATADGQAAAAPPAAAKPPTAAERIAAAAKAFDQTAAPSEAPKDASAAPEAPPGAATSEPPAEGQAAPEKPESASQLIRQRNEVADARKALDAERTKWRKEQAEHQAKLAAMERAFAEFEADPTAFAKARGTKRPLSEIAREFYVEDVDLASLPPDQAAHIRSAREQMQMRRNQARMEAEIRRIGDEHRLAVYRGQLAAGLAQIGDATPLVRALAADNPQFLLREMENEAGAALAKDPNRGILGTAQLAEILEPRIAAELEGMAKRFNGWFTARFKAAPAVVSQGAPAKAQASHAAAQEKAAAQPSLSSDLTGATPTSTKPMTDAERIAAAVKAMEAASRARA